MAALLAQALVLGVIINISLAAFNMITIPPLDGHWVLQSIGGRPIEELFDLIRPYSFIILMILINFPDIFRTVLGPVTIFSYGLVLQALAAGQQLAIR